MLPCASWIVAGSSAFIGANVGLTSRKPYYGEIDPIRRFAMMIEESWMSKSVCIYERTLLCGLLCKTFVLMLAA